MTTGDTAPRFVVVTDGRPAYLVRALNAGCWTPYGGGGGSSMEIVGLLASLGIAIWFGFVFCWEEADERKRAQRSADRYQEMWDRAIKARDEAKARVAELESQVESLQDELAALRSKARRAAAVLNGEEE